MGEKKVVGTLKKVYVDTKDYNIIRSIIESSTKPYHWNEPVEALIPGNGIKFVKYRFNEKKWEIVIQQITYKREGMELYINYVVVFDGKRNEVVTCAIRHQFSPEDEESKKNYIIRICGSCDDVVITADSIHELEYYVIEPSCPSCVPYAEPISLADFVNKLMFYYKKAILYRFSH